MEGEACLARTERVECRGVARNAFTVNVCELWVVACGLFGLFFGGFARTA